MASTGDAVPLPKPNIIYFLADDIGWADVGYHNSVIPTPFLDNLSAQGIRFERHYVHPMCTPTRAALMTGKYASNTGLVWAMVPGSPAGLTDDLVTLPQELRALGYRTAMAGKWHLGHSQNKVTPVGKGFMEHLCVQFVTDFVLVAAIVGCSLRDIDSYKKQMSEKPWNPLTLDWVKAFENGSYTHYAEPRHATEAITSEAQRMIRDHAGYSATNSSETPLFLYVAFTAAHSPLQPDPVHAEKCRHIPHLWRRQFCGMVVGVDEAVRNITETALSLLGPNTIAVFSSDNGGSTWFGGLNQPLRGGKSTPLEGGVKVPAFAVDFTTDGLYLGKGGWQYSSMVHISDWFPTLISAAGGSLDRHIKSGGDGINMRPALLNRDRSGHRHETLLDMYYANDFIFKENLVSYVVDDMKIIEGFVRDPHWYSESSVDAMNSTDTTMATYLGEWLIRALECVLGGPAAFDITRGLIAHSVLHPYIAKHSDMYSGTAGNVFLFNLTADPGEQHNVAADHPNLVRDMKLRLEQIRVKRPPQQKFWMQWHMTDEWPKTFVKGDCSMNPNISPSECHFTHPWISDNADPWDHNLIDSNDYAHETALKILNTLLAAVLGIVAIIVILFNFRKRKS